MDDEKMNSSRKREGAWLIGTLLLTGFTSTRRSSPYSRSNHTHDSARQPDNPLLRSCPPAHTLCIAYLITQDYSII